MHSPSNFYPIMSEIKSPQTHSKIQQCVSILAELKQHEDALPFLPSRASGLSDGPNLLTIEDRLNNGAYSSADEFDLDINRMFSSKLNSSQSDADSNKSKALKSYYDTSLRPQLRLTKNKNTNKSGKQVNDDKNGLSADKYAQCYDIFNGLMKVKHRKYNWPFLSPVKEEEAPGYFTIITKPIDLSTIRNKLENKKYKSVDEFIADILLMFKNCKTYNIKTTEVYRCGEELERVARILIAKHFENELMVLDLQNQLSEAKERLTNLEGRIRTDNPEWRIVELNKREELANRLKVCKDRRLTEDVAEILYRHKAYYQTDGEEIEVDFYTVPDKVMNEIIKRVNEQR